MKLLFLLCSIIPTIINGSTGGNCENVCNYQIDNYWTPCIEANCPQMGHSLCPTKNATTCVCSKNCQMCVDDLFNECGGCTNKKVMILIKMWSLNIKKLQKIWAAIEVQLLFQ